MTGTDAGSVKSYLGVHGQVDIEKRRRGTEGDEEGGEVINERERGGRKEEE